MKPIHWILGGIGLGATIAFLLFYEPDLQHETGSENIEDAANQAWRWGSKKRLAAAADTIAGRVKKGIGQATGDENLADEGVLNQAAGAVKDTAGRWGHAVGQTIHDLNR